TLFPTRRSSDLHRGQDSAGLGIISNGAFTLHRELGLVDTALKDVNHSGAGVAIGHVRYPTIGGGRKEDAQPFFSRQPGIIMAHNGNVINYNEVKELLKERSINLSSTCDVEPILYIFCEEMIKIKKRNHNYEDVVKALKETFKIVKGAYSITAGMILDGKPTLFCAREPFGIRPAVWGRKNGSFICASESACLDIIDAELMGDVGAGEVMFFRTGEEPKSFVIDKQGVAPCVFENVYFARPDSISNGRSIYLSRIDLGRVLGREFLTKNINVDIVTPVPDTSIPAALSLSEVIGKPFREGLIKNRYAARTFIMPTQSSREDALRIKLNPIVSQIRDKKILLVDDSIVRGTTLKRMVALLKEKGKVKEVHVAIHCPPVLNPCYYGIDMSVKEDLIAHRKKVKLGMDNKFALNINEQRLLEAAIAEHLGADSVTYLSIDGLNEIFGKERCAACFDGQYPIKIEEKYSEEIRKDRLCISSCNSVNS
ncbi:MAG: amidophosphoribosyltransferase, partial [Pseudomonadota bacterium]